VAEEDFHQSKRKKLIDDQVNEDDKRLYMSNVPDPPDEMAAPDESICLGPLTFDPSLPISADDDVTLAAADDQAEFM
jgi:hypothetical protein